ncbi:molybdopterin molybdotransferase [Methanolinea mesophila]|uniref:molybdopterin molybdotransferase MoeA n=1 Tax=Methanolinea mesophila TaxID=547055 RepID=UPI001AE3E90E|nr:gephyrin-like molybdotransferase Glp [Methanolinea mesophila]MBP1929866.1 molybdopterin molybdotransferase [Methanolinea mesophila]
MSLFFRTISVDEALRIAREIASPVGTEEVPLETAAGRVLASEISSDDDIPGFPRSVVDGYAVRAADTVGSSDAIPAMLALSGRVSMGTLDAKPVVAGGCVYVPTGGALPEGADAVAMVEYSESLGDQVLVKRPVAPGENVVMRGEDFTAGVTVLEAGRCLSPRDTGVLAAVGCVTVPVRKKPVVGVISTGNELVPVKSEPGPGQVRDVNTYLCSSYIASLGCTPRAYGITKDDRESLRAVLGIAVHECDAVFISGGSSKDDRDMSADLIREIGEVLAHGIAIAPGKPTILGRSGGKPVIGLPGHPASAFIVLMIIGGVVIRGLLGEEESRPCMVRAKLARNIPSAKGREDYVRVTVKEGVADPVFGKSGLLNTLVKSDGIVRIPAGREGLEVNEEVEVILW